MPLPIEVVKRTHRLDGPDRKVIERALNKQCLEIYPYLLSKVPEWDSRHEICFTFCFPGGFPLGNEFSFSNKDVYPGLFIGIGRKSPILIGRRDCGASEDSRSFDENEKKNRFNPYRYSRRKHGVRHLIKRRRQRK